MSDKPKNKAYAEIPSHHGDSGSFCHSYFEKIMREDVRAKITNVDFSNGSIYELWESGGVKIEYNNIGMGEKAKVSIKLYRSNEGVFTIEENLRKIEKIIRKETSRLF